VYLHQAANVVVNKRVVYRQTKCHAALSMAQPPKFAGWDPIGIQRQSIAPPPKWRRRLSSHKQGIYCGLRSGCASVLLCVSQHCRAHGCLCNRKMHSQHVVVQADQARLAKNQVKVLQSLRHPEALALV
jgi:hypothetical protein